MQAQPSEILASISHEHEELLRPLIEPLQIVPKLDPPKEILPAKKEPAYDPAKAKYKAALDTLTFASELYKEESAKSALRQNIKDFQNGGLKY